ncbi:helix-turn-helix domain-containing protein [Bernardetia sp. OM2101]|uniref:helix-turn-helix domain-containing protein n=1 Tax=Bernardetia sp. OM2101 TaxID=3344876 RepID=UPI0035D0F3B2
MRGKKRFISLSIEEVSSLEQGWKEGKSSTFRTRCHYILLSHQGKKVSEIMDFYQVTRQLVIRWFNRYEKEGIAGLETSKGQGRRPILRIDNEEEMNKVESLVEASPQSLKVVVSQLEEELGKSMSVKTLKRLLKKKMVLETLQKSNC